jgi:phosphonate transport system ATP-binding protein
MEVRARATPNESPSFKLEKVTRRWGDRVAIRNLSVAIERGQKVALIGPSGGGKSTLIRLLAGVLRPSSGHIYVDGRDLGHFSTKELRRHRAHCRIIEQNHLLVPQLTVHQNTIAGDLPHWSWYKATMAALWPFERQRVRKILEALGIGDHQWRLSSELSGGQMQRVAVARALISEPVALFADEPTASLDPATARAVTELILREAEKRGVTLVFCTHWLDIVRAHCDRVLGLRDGALVLDIEASRITQDALELLYEGSDERV